MIIPTLVLVSAMQFGDPQSGARINDLSHSPWREVAVVKPVSYTTQSNDIPELPTSPATMPMPPSIPGGNEGFGNSPMETPGMTPPGGVIPGTNMPVPQAGYSASQTAMQRSAMPSNGSGAPGASLLLVQNANDYSGPTKIENNKVYLSRAKVQFDKITPLSTPVSGIVLEQRTENRDAQGNVLRASNGKPVMIDLQRGVMVFTGQQIAQLDDRHAQAQFSVANTKLDVARMEAEQTIGMDYAKAQYDTAYSDWKRSYDIAKRTPGAVTDAELEVKQFKVIESQLQMKKAENDHKNQQESVKVQEQEVEVAKTQLDLRKIKTPFNGMVVNVVSQVGKSLREGDPIAEVAMLDKLKVIANVDGNKITREQVDKKRVSVTARSLNGQTDEFAGFVRYAAPSFNHLRQFEVEIEVDNKLVNGHWQLQEGDYVDVVIHL